MQEPRVRGGVASLRLCSPSSAPQEAMLRDITVTPGYTRLNSHCSSSRLHFHLCAGWRAHLGVTCAVLYLSSSCPEDCEDCACVRASTNQQICSDFCPRTPIHACPAACHITCFFSQYDSGSNESIKCVLRANQTCARSLRFAHTHSMIKLHLLNWAMRWSAAVHTADSGDQTRLVCLGGSILDTKCLLTRQFLGQAR